MKNEALRNLSEFHWLASFGELVGYEPEAPLPRMNFTSINSRINLRCALLAPSIIFAPAKSEPALNVFSLINDWWRNGVRMNGLVAELKTYNPQPRNLKNEILQWRRQQTIPSISIHSTKPFNPIKFNWLCFINWLVNEVDSIHYYNSKLRQREYALILRVWRKDLMEL